MSLHFVSFAFLFWVCLSNYVAVFFNSPPQPPKKKNIQLIQRAHWDLCDCHQWRLLRFCCFRPIFGSHCWKFAMKPEQQQVIRISSGFWQRRILWTLFFLNIDCFYSIFFFVTDVKYTQNVRIRNMLIEAGTVGV